jgi:ubiquinone/menaquinone biosynthesis C-methylase UbiE
MEEKNKKDGIEHIKALFDNISQDYEDVYLQSLEPKVFGYVTGKHLQQFLPENKDAIILDAGGGTGRWTRFLAKRGYRVVLCDISSGMLAQAEKKLREENLFDKVEIRVEDIASLSFESEMFDFVMCEDGPFSITPETENAAKELTRVLKRGGIIWTGGVGRYPVVLQELKTDPEKALKLAQCEQNFVRYKGAQARIFNPEELEELFKKNGVTIEKMYGYRIATQVFPPGYEEKEGRMVKSGPSYTESFINKVAEIELLLSEDPSLLGMADYIQIVGRKVDA